MALEFAIRSDTTKLDTKLIHAVLTAISGGELIVFPTDTIYGLGCDAFNAQAIQRIRDVKERPKSQTFSVHVGKIDEVKHYAHVSERENELVERLLPGPYTLVLNASDKSPPECISDEGKIGIRVPDSNVFRRFYEIAKQPLIGTSINRSGQPPINQVSEIIKLYGDSIEIVISTDIKLSGTGSSVIDITSAPPRLIRGSLPSHLKL